MKKSFSYPIIFMVVLTAIFTFVLAFLNYSTAERIAFNQETELWQKILYVFDIPVEDNAPETIKEVFNQYIEEEEVDGDIIYSLRDGDEVVGYAFPARGAGLWGSIEAYVAVRADYSEIIGLEFISHSETPGLGGRISESDFKEQFRDLNLDASKDGNYIVYRPAPGGNADAIAGATLTSKSVSNFLNEDIVDFIKGRKGE